ncbi:MAG: hypothetical protein WCF94_01885 [bacterium]
MQPNNDKLFAILAYILFFIPLLATKDRSQFLTFHINQGLNLFIFEIGVGYIVPLLLSFIPMLGFVVWILQIGLFILFIMGVMNASQNKMEPLPIIGNVFNFIK